ncbi:hypothetical protein KAR91_78845 [Candidatus Pacearchaeota archaeon]|nr:hypothetical protein [Candidatus Pacearchaeota archaeon]
MGQSLAIPRVIPNDWKRLDLIVNKIKMRLGRDSTPTFSNINITNVITASTSVFSKICTVAAGLNVLRVTGLQTDATALTGTLRGAYIDVSNGSTEATGTIRALELKARTEAPGDTGSKVAVLEGLSISADSKGHSVTTMRAAEFILDGSLGGTIDEAVGLRIANNLQADKATNSYGLQIYRDSFDYTYDISLSLGGHITGDSYVNQDLRTTASPTYAGLTLTDLTTSSLVGTNASKLIESVTVGTGLDYTRPNLTLSHLGIEALTDPGVDRIIFWDDSATPSACKWLGVGSSIAITTTTIDTIQDIRTSASPTFVNLFLTEPTQSRLVDIGDTGFQGANITDYLFGTVNQITATDDGSGGVTLSFPANISIGTGKLTCGTINRTAGTLQLAISNIIQVFITNTAVTLAGNFVIPDAGYIGSVSDTTAIQIEADGDIVLSQDLYMTGNVMMADDGTIGIADGVPKILFDDTDSYVEVTGDLTLASVNPATTSTHIRIADSSGNLDRVLMRATTNDIYFGDIDVNSGKLFLRANGATWLTILEDGKVGIGQTTPTDKLHIYQSINNNVRITIENPNQDANGQASFQMKSGGYQWTHLVKYSRGNQYAMYSTTLGDDVLICKSDGDVEIPNGNLGVNGSINSGTSTFSTVGPTDNVDVSGINTLFVDTSSNSVTIGGFAGGVDGQVLYVTRTSNVNNVIIEHNETGATQKIFLHAGADETLGAEYGGWVFICHDGIDWHDCSHAKHVP